MKRIDRFRLEYDYLSNFYPACVEVDGLRYLSSEAAFQAAKCAEPEDRMAFTLVSPDVAKSMGRSVRLRPDWEQVKTGEMEKILRAKFTQNPHLARFLVQTGDAELVEGNTWRDLCWGVDLKTGEGENRLGKLLMALREEFQKKGLPPEDGQLPWQEDVSADGLKLQFRDLTLADCDCIVNAANETLLGGGGVDAAIHRMAGPELLEACRKLNGCAVTEAKLTAGYGLKAKYIIHTVGPRYGKQEGEAQLLEATYRNVLDLAMEQEIHSIAFPAISAGKFSYPKEEATAIAVETVRQWKQAHPGYRLDVVFACVDLAIYQGFRKAMKG